MHHISRKKTLLALLLASMFLLAACTPAGKAMDLLKGGVVAEEAAQWLRENADDSMESLCIMLGSPVESRAVAAQQALAALGDSANRYLYANFTSFTTRQRQRAIAPLTVTCSRQDIRRLLTLYAFSDITDELVAAVAQMGPEAARIIVSLMDDPQFTKAAQAYLLAFNSEDALPALLDELKGSHPTRSVMARDILSEYGEQAAGPLSEYALHEGQANERAVEVLAKYPHECIEAIAAHTCDDEGCPQRQAALLSSFGTEYTSEVIDALDAHPETGRGETILSAFIDIMGLETCLAAEYSRGDTQSAGFTLFSGIVKARNSVNDVSAFLIRQQDGAYAAVVAPLYLEEPYADIVAKVCVGDKAVFNGLMTYMTEADLQWLAQVVSRVASKDVNAALEALLPGAQDSGYANSLLFMAGVGGSNLPRHVFEVLLAGNTENSVAAMNALVEASTQGKFAFDGIDYMQYAEPLIALLGSEDTEISMLAQMVINRIPETEENRAFYVALYERQPSKEAFMTLALNYSAAPSSGMTIKFSDGSTKTIQSVKLVIEPTWKIIPSQDRPNMTRSFTDVIQALGLSVSDSSADVLTISFVSTPLSKSYPGLLSRSYTGSECTYTITLSADGKSASYSGGYTQAPPERISVGQDTYAYASDPTDGPNMAVLKVGATQGLGNLFGTEGLLVMYGKYPEEIEKFLDQKFAQQTQEDEDDDTVG